MSKIIKSGLAALAGFVTGEVVIVLIGVIRLASLTPAHPFNGDIKFLGIPIVGIMYHNSNNLGVTIGPKYLGLPIICAALAIAFAVSHKRANSSKPA